MYLDSSVFWLRAVVLLYGVGLVHVLVTLIRQKQDWFAFALGCFSVGATLHFVSLTELAIHHQSFPLNNVHETASACAFLSAISFLVIHSRYQFRGLAMFLFPLVFILTLIGATEVPIGTWSNRGVRDFLLTAHILPALLGYALLFLTAGASLFYLIQERNLKLKIRSSLFDRLPSLTTLDDLVSRAMGWGFVSITISVIIAAIWGFIETGTRWIFNGPVIISLITWLLFLIMVFLRTSGGWRGRKAAILALTVLGCSSITWITHSWLVRSINQ